jgi:hypothetical protein
MALDLYVGPLCRYHAGDWKNVGQRYAEAQGLQYQIARPNPLAATDAAPPEEIAGFIRFWQQQLAPFIAAQGEPLVEWEEDPAADYATERPGWEGLAGLVFKFAYLLQPQFPAPETVPSLESLDKDPAYSETIKEPSLVQILSMCQLWLPGPFQLMFQAETITGQPVVVSSTTMLNMALDTLCELWNKDRVLIEGQSTNQPDAKATLDDAARHGLAVFCRMAREAHSRSLPMIMDY